LISNEWSVPQSWAFAFAVVLGLLGVLFLLRELILRGYLLAPLRIFLQEFFAPGGMFKRRQFGRLDLSGDGGKVNLVNSHSYVGDYELGISFSKRLPMPLPRKDLDVNITITATSYGAVMRSWSAGDDPIPWWDEGCSGFVLIRFNVPLDIPRLEEIEFELSVERGSPFPTREYGDANIYIGKSSEK
jgi:hypothetical protein